MLERIGQVAGNIWNEAVPFIATGLGQAWTFITGIWDSIYNYLAGIAGDIYDAVAPRWEAIVISVTGNVMATWDVITAVWGAIVDLATAVWDGVVAAWQWGVEAITGATADGGQQTTTLFGTIIDAGNWLRDAMSDVFYTIEYAIGHWQDFFELAGTKVALAVVTAGNTIQYIFEEVIGTSVGYVLASLAVGFTNFYDETTTIFSNLGNNLVAVFKSLPGLISGQTKWSDVWTPLTKGFEENVVQWPGIAARQKGDLEKQLGDESDYLSDNFAKGLGDHLADRHQQADKAGQSIADGLKNAFKTPTQPITAPKIGQPDPLHPKIDPSNLSLSITPQIKHANAINANSAQAQLNQYAGPQLAAIANGTAQTGSPITPKSPTPISAPLGGTAASGGASSDPSELLTLQYLLQIQKNTAQPVLAMASF